MRKGPDAKNGRKDLKKNLNPVRRLRRAKIQITARGRAHLGLRLEHRVAPDHLGGGMQRPEKGGGAQGLKPLLPWKFVLAWLDCSTEVGTGIEKRIY